MKEHFWKCGYMKPGSNPPLSSAPRVPKNPSLLLPKPSRSTFPYLTHLGLGTSTFTRVLMQLRVAVDALAGDGSQKYPVWPSSSLPWRWPQQQLP